MKIICIIVLVICFAICSSAFVKHIRKSKKEKDLFIEYLEEKKDFETLIDIGFYNKQCYREDRRVPDFCEILKKKYYQNKDDTYMNYCIYSEKVSFRMVGLFLLCFFIFVLLITLLQN